MNLCHINKHKHLTMLVCLFVLATADDKRRARTPRPWVNLRMPSSEGSAKGEISPATKLGVNWLQIKCLNGTFGPV